VTALTSTLSLELDSKPQSVALVRGMLSAVFERLELGLGLLDDVNMAVSEACNNVVVHAYGDDVGPMQIGLELGAQDVVVVVRDHGVGLHERPPSEDRLGVGLGMMDALATRADFLDGDGGGTEVRLRFACEALWALTEVGSIPPVEPGSRVELRGDAVVPSCPIPFLAPVMSRLATMLAAGAHFSLDRLSDLRLLTDAICEQVRDAALGERIGFALAAAVRRLELVIGPLRRGTGESLSEVDWLTSPSLVPLRLADELTLVPGAGHEVMRVVVSDRSSQVRRRA
jgi:serine/threonine-protein kinase RsbW